MFRFFFFFYLLFRPTVSSFKVRSNVSDIFFLNVVESFRAHGKRKSARIRFRRNAPILVDGNRYLCCRKKEEDFPKSEKEFLKENGTEVKETEMVTKNISENEQSIFPLNMDWIKVINLISKGNDVDTLTLAFNAGLSAAEKKGCLTTMLELFETMKRKNIKPDLVSYKLILSLCEKYHLSENAEMLFEEMTAQDKILPNYEIYSLMISCFSKRGNANKAIEYFEKLRNDPFIEDRKKINTAVDPTRIEKWKQGEMEAKTEVTALQKETETTSSPKEKKSPLYGEHHVYNQQFSEISGKIKNIEKKYTRIQYSEYANVIFACNLGNAHDDGIRYFEELLNNETCIPSIFVFENIFDLLGKNGNYEKALQYYNILKKDENLKNNINVNILNNLLKSLGVYCKINIIEEVWNNEFDELSLTPNDISYQLMLKVYSDMDAYDKAYNLFKEMHIKTLLHKNNLLPFLYTIDSFKTCGIYNYAIYVLRIAAFVNMSKENLLLLYNNTLLVCMNAKRYDVIISLYAELIKLQQKDDAFHLNIHTLSFVLLAFKELNMKQDFKSLKNLIVQKNYKLTPLCVKLFEESKETTTD